MQLKYFIAGPCSVESEEQALSTAKLVKSHGATHFRAMLFKPRSDARSFQGLGAEDYDKGLEILRKCRKELPVVSEVMDEKQLALLKDEIDIVQIGARNCQNYSLLKAVNNVKKRVILKRGLAVTLKEWLSAASYLEDCDVIFCERGIRTFETATRFTFDVNIIPLMKNHNKTIIADPSHGIGLRPFVPQIAKAAVAAGADGLLVEVHPEPEKAKSDSQQQLNFDEFSKLAQWISDYHG